MWTSRRCSTSETWGCEECSGDGPCRPRDTVEEIDRFRLGGTAPAIVRLPCHKAHHGDRRGLPRAWPPELVVAGSRGGRAGAVPATEHAHVHEQREDLVHREAALPAVRERCQPLAAQRPQFGSSAHHQRHERTISDRSRRHRVTGWERPESRCGPKVVDAAHRAVGRSSTSQQHTAMSVQPRHRLPWVHPEVAAHLDRQRVPSVEQWGQN